MSCSREEIERKRLLALQRKQQAQLKNNASSTVKTQNNVPSTSIINNENKSFSSFKPFQNAANKSDSYKAKIRDNSFKSNTKFNQRNERFSPIGTKKFFGQKACATGKCHMISDTRFTLETSSYLPAIIEVCKTIPSRSYDVKTKTWNFNLVDYESLIEKLAKFKSDIQITGLPKTVLQIFRKSDIPDSNAKDIDLSKIDSHLVSQLMPFQRDGICYGISKGGRCLVADDMGLGKTIQALGIAHYFKQDWPLLIVVPPSVRYQWAEAIYTFLPSVPTHYVHHFTSAKDFVDDYRIVITSYDLLVRAIDTFERRTFGFVILDESHALKNIKTARYKAVQCIASQAGHIVLLSGTPALSRPIELYSQINLIMRNFMKYQDYGIRYCAGETTSFGWDFTGSSNMQELQLLLKRTCLIRRVKNEVLNALPTKKREIVMVDADLQVGAKEMQEMSKKLECTSLSGKIKHETLLQYYFQSSFAKEKAICEYISTLLKDKRKCLIFAHHQHILNAVSKVAESMDIKYIRIDGNTSPTQRKEQVDKFQNCEDVLAAMLSIRAANAGITLTAAKLVVFVELFWNPGVLCQAEDRVHRIGQDEDVLIQYLVAKKTADDHLWPLIQRKMSVLNEVGLDQDFSLENVNVRKHGLDKKQRSLDDFTISPTSESAAGVETPLETEIDESTNDLWQDFCETKDETKELLVLDEEDLNFCDWDDME